MLTQPRPPRRSPSIMICVAISLLAAAVGGCSTRSPEPRAMLPADALIYLETRDAQRMLTPITTNERFRAASQGKVELSALDGVALAVAVTGFEASEQPADENLDEAGKPAQSPSPATVEQTPSVITFQPKFVAAIETNAWSWQVESFVENQLGNFVNEAYGGAIELEITSRDEGEYYVWTSPDQRKAFALRMGSLVLFSTDETGIERCLAVKRGEVASMGSTGKLPVSDAILASGYVSPEGVGQVSNIAGMQFAKNTAEEAEVQSFVARVLPEVLKRVVKDIVWTATASNGKIDDLYTINLQPELAKAVSESVVPSSDAGRTPEAYTPSEAAAVTRYVPKDPRLAWRSLVLAAGTGADQELTGLITSFADSFFEPYGIENAERYLGSVGPAIVTVRMAADDEDAAAIAMITDEAGVRESLAEELRITGDGEMRGPARLYRSEDGELGAAFADGVVISGDLETVIRCLAAKDAGANAFQSAPSSDAVALTFGTETGRLDKLVSMLGQPNNAAPSATLNYSIETRIGPRGIERRTVSDFGLIGALLERMMPD